MEIEATLNELDRFYKEIWNLNFKDFEDLRAAMESYDELVSDLESNIDDMNEEQQSRLEEHIRHTNYYMNR